MADVQGESRSTARPPSTRGKMFGLGRKDLKPREHCKRCHEIVAEADQIVQNYVMMNARQLQAIDRLLDNSDAGAEVQRLNEFLAERDAALLATLEVLRLAGHTEAAANIKAQVFTADGKPVV